MTFYFTPTVSASLSRIACLVAPFTFLHCSVHFVSHVSLHTLFLHSIHLLLSMMATPFVCVYRRGV